jgi:adenylylsulfate kinase-like enzyme
MRSGFTSLLVVAIAVVSMTAAPRALSADQHRAANVITIHVNAHTGNGVAKDVNELHAKMEKEGWHFVSMVAHTENGDTEGVWVTYTR